MADRSKAIVYGRSLAEIAGSNPAGVWMSVSCECCVLWGRNLCDGPIPRPGESYRLWCLTSSMKQPRSALSFCAGSKENNSQSVVPTWRLCEFSRWKRRSLVPWHFVTHGNRRSNVDNFCYVLFLKWTAVRRCCMKFTHTIGDDSW